MKFTELSALAVASVAVAGLAATSAAQAKTIELTYRFPVPDVTACSDARSGCAPWTAALPSMARELHPVVPVRIARVLLPDGEEIESVGLTGLAPKPLRFTARLAVRQMPLTPGAVVARDVPAYDGGAYPTDWLGAVKIAHFRGYAVAQIPIYPLRIMSATEASYIDSAHLVVTTKPSADYGSGDAALRRPAARRDAYEAADRVDNGDDAEARIVPPSEEVGYLIIGPRALIGTEADTPLRPLIQDKEGRQLIVKMAALEDVSASKNPAEIRSYIRDRYQHDSIDYVLLIGDKENLPWKYVGSGMRDRSDPVPSDQYYACLDGDFASPDAIDWACEVSVGRVGARTRDDVAHWVAKTLQLQRVVTEKRTDSILSYGEKLDGQTLAERSLEALLTGSERAPRSTGFPSAVKADKLYDTFRSEVSSAEFIAKLNAGDYHVVNHLGHANETYVFRTSVGQLSEFRSRPAFFYTEGCYPNDPDQDNWTIRAVRMADYGPAAMIANTRFGWYAPGNSDEGSSAMLHRTFWSMRFGNGVKTIGAMNHKAKEAVVGVDPSSVVIYTALESNLIGDPELDLGI